MISSIAWLPKGAAKRVPSVIKSAGAFDRRRPYFLTIGFVLDEANPRYHKRNFIAVGSMESSPKYLFLYRNIIASASADKRVKIWDVAAGKCNITMEHHTDKVQAIAWNHHAPQVILSGSFDHSVVMKDGRILAHSGYKLSVTTDVESLAWDPHKEHSFLG